MKTKFSVILTLFLVFIVQIAFAQQKTITGTVSDDTGPLPGVTVLIKGTTNGTETDFDGKYSISTKSGDVLVFSFVGKTKKEIIVGNSAVIDVALESDNLLEEVVVVGYGKSSKVDLTGSVVKLEAKEINATVAPSVEQVFQGTSPGVFVESQSGKLGGGIKINIRGVNSINAGTEPLYVVDGLAIGVDDFGAETGGTSTNALNNINPADIESIEILKDAASTAIYGSRGANGVVLITTKKGKSGDVRVNVSLSTGFAKPTRLRSFANAKQYAEITGPLFDSYYGAGVGDAVLNHLSNGTDWQNNEVDTDWQSLAFQDAVATNASVNFSGGGDKTRFYSAFSHSDKEGIYVGSNQKRISGLLNIDSKYKGFLDFGIKMSYSRNDLDQVTSDNAFSTPIQLVAQAPISPVYDDNGNAIDYTLGFGTGYYNTIVELQNSFYFSVTDNILGNAYFNFKLMNGLTLNTQLGINQIYFRQENFKNSLTQDARADNGSKLQYNVEQTVISPTVYLSYDKNLADGKHILGLTAGFETRYNDRNTTQIRATGFETPGLTNIENATSIDNENTFTRVTDDFFRSFFGRFNYKLNNKYLLGLSARFDSSSKFGEKNRTGFFPSVSAGWKISEEDFLKDSEVISFLKLRSSYGILGNSNIGNHRDKTLYETGVYSGRTTYVGTQLGNPDLGWEKTTQFDIGLEFGLLKNRINGEINYYNKETNDLLFFKPIPSISGENGVWSNIGDMSNKGIEVVLNGSIIKKEDFSWDVSLNFSKNKNTVESLPDGNILPTGSRFMNSVIEGESIGVFYGAEFVGVDPANGNPQYLAADGSIVNSVNDAELKVIGNPNPDWIGSITNTLRYKNLDLNFMFQTVQGNEVHLGGDSFMVGGWFDNILTSALDAWQQPGDITNTPRFDATHASQTSRFVSDASYIRLKNLSLGYNFNKNILDKLHINNLRIYFTGYNLLTITDYVGWDPEVNADYRSSNINIGSDFYSGPQEKSYTIGINIGI